MCTIGNAFLNREIERGNITFKQCDLTWEVEFFIPEIKTNQDIKYLPFLRDGSSGPWAGANNYGVCFVAADSYLDKDGKMKTAHKEGSYVFDKYLEIIQIHRNAEEAAHMMKRFYKEEFTEPDIIMITDADNSFFIEAYNGKVQMIRRKTGFFASANHFRMIHGAVPYAQNHSTYLRLARAESILECDDSKQGIFDVLSDQYYGETVWSVCRVVNEELEHEEPYFTQASVVFTSQKCTDGVVVDCSYVINGNPRTGTWVHMEDVFSVEVK
ncbi:MAG: hypothetical protein LUH22_10905 [Bacteroides sp.]|nr:hypothetical protein [Bacteroides sp.]